MSEIEKLDHNYAPTYFWSWNDKLENIELERQIDDMKAQGIGGFFMHARPGLKTEYMSDEWIDAIKTVISKCKKVGLNPWLYDEYGWPSGFNGGSVPRRGVDYQQKALKIDEREFDVQLFDIDNLLGIYIIENNESIQINKEYSGKGKVVVVYYNVIKDYVDLLSKKVVKAFIDDSYERYKKIFGDDFGKTIPGIFTDEPQYSPKDYPWSFDFNKEFLKTYNEDLKNFLPLLKYDLKGCEEFRYKFYSMVNKMFVNNYFKQINDWCIANNLIFTGHNMAEDSMYDSMLYNAGVMPTYKHMVMPGTDWVSRTIRETTTPKQAASVAAQFNKPRVLTEQLASCNWDIPLEEIKWMLDWNFVNGVNFFCQHLAAYSLKGLRKRDCPASLFSHNVWWDDYHLLTTYLTRISTILSNNDQVVDSIVIHPLKSAYLHYNRVNDGEMLRLDNNFLAELDFLSAIHVDYHLGDEELIESDGKVEDDKFVIGSCSYKLVILPDIHTLKKSTLDKLLKFAKNGGIILSFGDMPTRIDGELADLSKLRKAVKDYSSMGVLQKFKNAITEKNHDGFVTSAFKEFWEKTATGTLPRCSLDVEDMKLIDKDEKTLEFINLVNRNGIEHIDVTSNNKYINNIHYYHKIYNGKNVYFLVNHDKKLSYSVEINIPNGKKYMIYNPLTNENEYIENKTVDSQTMISYTFNPMESLMIVEVNVIDKLQPANKQYIEFKKSFYVKNYNYNSYTMDYCYFKREYDNEWKYMPIWDTQYIMLKNMDDCDFEIKFNFEISNNFDLSNNIELGAEDIDESIEFKINNNNVLSLFNGFKIDRAIKTTNITKFIKQGINEIYIKRHYKYDQTAYYALFGKNVHGVMRNKLVLYNETENVFLFGKFAVYAKNKFDNIKNDGCVIQSGFYIDNENLNLKGLDIVKQGYLFFNDAIEVAQKCNIKLDKNIKYILKINRPNATSIHFIVNGNDIGGYIKQPYEVDITKYLVNGENEIGLKICTSNRNLFGNFHFKLGQIHWPNWVRQVDPNLWLFCNEEDSWYTDMYCFYRNGIIDKE